MTIFEAVLLGAVQGVFMFFPVSSTSHLALLQHFLIRRGSALPAPESAEMILFDLVVHVGTLVSIVVVFWPSLKGFLRSIAYELRTRGGAATLVPRRPEGAGADDTGKTDFVLTGEPSLGSWDRREHPEGRPPHVVGSRRPRYLFTRLLVLGFVSTAVTGALGFPIRAMSQTFFGTPAFISAMLVITGILLYATDVMGPRPRGLKELTLWVALAIGLAQGLSLAPGLSRSGLTISFALFAGLRRKWAAEYSFFIAFPTILVATGVQTISAMAEGASGAISLSAQAVGFTVSAVVGIGALMLVITLLYKARFRLFSYYVWMLAAFVAGAALAGYL